MKKVAVVLAVAGMLALTGCIEPGVKSAIETEREYIKTEREYIKLGKECFEAGGDWVSKENKPYRCNFVHKDLD